LPSGGKTSTSTYFGWPGDFSVFTVTRGGADDARKTRISYRPREDESDDQARSSPVCRDLPDRG
jgi:hypothetical protein